MASNALRNAVWETIKDDAQIQALGFPADMVFAAWSPDGPSGKRFIVIRWGTVSVGIGGVNRCPVSIWVYNRDSDYTPIVDAIKRIKDLLSPLEAQVLAPGHAVLNVDWAGDTEDQYDDGYRAYMRSTAYTITASGS